MSHFKHRLAIISVVIPILLILLIFIVTSKQCRFRFNNKCLSPSDYWTSFTFNDKKAIYEESLSQNLFFTSVVNEEKLVLTVTLLNKKYPARSEVFQYNQLNNSTLHAANSYYFIKEIKTSTSNNQLLIHCNSTTNEDICKFYEADADNSLYLEKTFSIFANPYSIVSLKKTNTVSDKDIEEILELITPLLD